MGFSVAKLIRCLLVIGVALAAVYSAEAQQAGQKILFSSPDDYDAGTNVPSLAAKPPGSLDFANAIQSPGLNMNNASQAGTPVGSQPPVISPGQALQMQRLLDRRKKWSDQTAEEILDLPTQNKIFGIADQDSPDNLNNDAAIARYFGQDQSRVRTNNDNYSAPYSTQPPAFSDDRALQVNPDVWTPRKINQNNQSGLDQLFSTKPDSQDALNSVSRIGISFDLPTALSKPTAEQKAAQQAADESFLKLLQPRSPTTDSASAPAFGDRPFSPPAPPPSATEPPTTIPIGASYAPLNDLIGMPVGVDALPGLFGPTNAPLPAYVPEWKPQAPPWASSAPRLGAPPQRKF